MTVSKISNSLKKNVSKVLHLDTEYVHFFNELKIKLKTAQIRAALSVNIEQIYFYWEMGKSIIYYQKTKVWGSKFLEQLSRDLRNEFPEMQGFSVTNLKRMRLFAEEYPDLEKGAQSVHQLPWSFIVVLLHKIKDPKKREWYVQQTLKQGWSRTILEMQIESSLFERQADTKKIENFEKYLPRPQSDLARELLKDPYKFDFLTIQEESYEREVENALIHHIRDFLLELGQGFAFVGSQVPLTFEDQEFFVDLLFYHLDLQSYVVIELKATKFKPEHTGQLGFYLAAVDDQLRKEHDNRTIGILLCKTKDKIVAEYALRNINAPIGVSEYVLSNSLPKELKTKLPSIEEIEAELNEGTKVQL